MKGDRPRIKAGRVPVTEAFQLDRNWQPPRGHRRTTKSTFGPQALSKRVTAPSFGFGSSTRDDQAKIYVSAAMAKKKPGNFSPGPTYDVMSSFGKQPTSQCESPPEIKIGSASRWKKRKPDAEPGPGAYDNQKSSFGPQVISYKKSPEKYVFSRGTRDQANNVYLSVEFDKAKLGSQSPGPSVYGAKTTFGPQLHSKNRTAPLINFTKGQRDQVKIDLDCAGPGQYKIGGSVGRQTESQKSTVPAFSFPQCSRDRMNKVFLSKEHDKAHYGEVSPGPAAYKSVSSIGKQANSRCVNPPVIRFTKGLRWNPPINDIPGPGAYDC